MRSAGADRHVAECGGGPEALGVASTPALPVRRADRKRHAEINTPSPGPGCSQWRGHWLTKAARLTVSNGRNVGIGCQNGTTWQARSVAGGCRADREEGC